ncbi:hypothetical protein FOVSG1_014545 [Fusarium oxysporum f. sp. vasinfectum]
MQCVRAASRQSGPGLKPCICFSLSAARSSTICLISQQHSHPPQVNRNSNHRRTNLASESIDWDMNARLTLTTLVGLQRLYASIPPSCRGEALPFEFSISCVSFECISSSFFDFEK